ncbi:hypothetical protein M446_6202 [Methylobacterium sp. 4-46]|uniref:hypothetical protein n=1 Tax=unclassified Methylobacterium TaxID=2615210 RepID=UPI000165CE11|nr:MULTISPECIES: hypothetical protein [Methylobacterium]ACA20470.1 hypothetical protein M446_6202 [Methylobacterium sp. 4-46]WFT79638.1 hypothetical protein QA634_31330 [Methylobacterium nodulans]
MHRLGRARGSIAAARLERAAMREGRLFLEGCGAVWTACLGWVALRTARYILD